MLVVYVLCLGLDLIIIQHVIVNLKGMLQGYPQVDIFRHFAGEGHRGFLEDFKIIIIDRLFGNGKQRESFWQYKLDTFVPRGLNTRQIDICSWLMFFLLLVFS